MLPPVATPSLSAASAPLYGICMPFIIYPKVVFVGFTQLIALSLASNRMFSGMAGFYLDQPEFVDELANVLPIWHPESPSIQEDEY